MSIQSVLTYIRRAKVAILAAEDEMEATMKTLGLKSEQMQKPPGRPFGSKNKAQKAEVAPGEAQDEVKAG